tara:strand:- start:182 stop:754 length:573 start_codon:yes stop_codon:yes gene_type:complete
MKLRLVKMKSVKSTNDTAIRLIKKNQSKPTLVTSVIQRKGRGTMGKRWISQKGNLFISIFFEINQKRINFKQFAILNAYLIKKIITKYASKKIDIKWPNDLLIKKEKVCGILQEVIDYNNKKFLIIGVGINTNFSPIVKRFKSTSLHNIGKKNINNNQILKDIKKVYENFINDIKKYTFLELKKKLVKSK